MKTVCTFVIVFACAFCVDTHAGPPASTKPLECLVRSSTLIVDADIIDEDPGMQISETVIGNLGVTIHCREALLGQLPSKDMTLVVSRYIASEDGWPMYLHKGHRCIFFLRPASAAPGLESTELWFSEQPYSVPLAWEIKSLKTPP